MIAMRSIRHPLPAIALLLLPLIAAAEQAAAPAKLTALSRVEISSDIAAKITEVKVRDGDRFASGDLLARFDCTELRAELDSAAARRDMARRQLRSNTELRDLGGNISELELLQSEAQLAEAAARARVLQHRAGSCDVRAPFDGFVIKRAVQPHQRVDVGAPLFELLDNRSLEVEVIVPSAWLDQLAPGDAFRVRIEETGALYSATLLRIVPAVDPVTRSVRVIGGMAQSDALLVAGMSGEAFFEIDRAAAAGAVAGVDGSESR